MKLIEQNQFYYAGCGTTYSTPAPHRLKLAQLQALVGGWIEIIQLPEGRQLIVNEEGAIRRLPFNLRASQIAGREIYGSAVCLAARFALK